MDKNIKVNLFSILTITFWAAAFPMTKFIGDAVSVYSLACVRCVVAALLLGALGCIQKIQKPKSLYDVFLFILAGLSGFTVYLIFFSKGLLYISSATSAVVIAIVPIVVAMAAQFIYKEMINTVGWICLFCAFIGVAILMLYDGGLSINIGVLWTLGAAMLFVIYNLLSRKLADSGYSGLEIVTYAMICGAIASLPFAPGAITEFSAAGIKYIGSAVFLGIMPSGFSYMMWAKALAIADRTTQVTNYMFVTPLLATVLGLIILGEMPDLGTYIGGTIIIISIIVFNLRKK